MSPKQDDGKDGDESEEGAAPVPADPTPAPQSESATAMKLARLGRRRHLRRSKFERYRKDPSGVHRQAVTGVWARWMGALSGTGSDLVFTAGVTPDLTSVGHGLSSGDGPFILTNAGGALPAGLDDSTHYFVEVLDVDTFTLHTSIGSPAVQYGDVGTGVHTITKASDEVDGTEAGYHYNLRHRPETIEAATDVDDL